MAFIMHALFLVGPLIMALFSYQVSKVASIRGEVPKRDKIIITILVLASFALSQFMAYDISERRGIPYNFRGI